MTHDEYDKMMDDLIKRVNDHVERDKSLNITGEWLLSEADKVTEVLDNPDDHTDEEYELAIQRTQELYVRMNNELKLIVESLSKTRDFEKELDNLENQKHWGFDGE